jgi:branched-chain amino acid transport system substrate-binding protein
VPTTSRRMLLAAGLAAAAAGGAGPRAVRAAGAPPLAVGALFPFSGSLSLMGDESFRGLDLATDERNAAGGLLGRPVTLVRGDTTEPAQATAEAKRLLEQAKAVCVFGTYAAGIAIAGSAVTELAGVPYFELDALADAVTERGLKMIFRSGPVASAVGILSVDAVADLLAPAWGADLAALKLALLHEDGPTGSAVGAAEEQRCRERNLPLAERIPYPTTSTDMAPLAQRLRGAAPDVVLHTGHANDVVLLHRALKQAGWRPRMVIGAGGGYSLNDTAQALGADFEGVMNVDVTQYRVSDIVAPGVSEVAAAYQRKYGAPPRSGHSLVCYAGARLFFDIVQRAGTFEHDKLRATMLATDAPPGSSVGGFGVKFDEKGQNVRAVPYLTQWQKGALVTIAPKNAAVAELVPMLGG